ncbi:isochorismate synthase [Corynebacterium lowii]|uniref:isochorismate synthase n=1 Tax=Corynebacterium lowii TaxID=1544413 RepID=A0A0Q0UAK1_9CORY|nr:isochorismate synthase [Corynebacterium lowii]KQB84800.1 Isochorismate synthase DhbC [Corynebacterium lowii]MDP9851704.1 isochorismate synthase [Corynebacterium lowii]
MPKTPASNRAVSRNDLFFWQGRGTRYAPAQALSAVPAARSENPWRPGTIVAGALPFDVASAAAPALWELPAWEEAEPLLLDAAAPARLRNLRPASAPGNYISAVRRAVEELSAAETPMEKVVLAREVRAELAEEPAWPDLLASLVERNPTATTFSVPLPGGASGAGLSEGDPADVFFGATPELLLRKEGATVLSHPLAGSIPRSANPEEDRRRAEGLLLSAKDAHEHAFVTQMIGQALAPVCAELDVPAQPSLLATDTMWHLGTRISGRLKAEEQHRDALSLARLLHPTPAVAGWPTGAAMSAIRDLEHADRGLYAGAVGWVDANGDGQWSVSIRCGLLRGLELSAWGGAGIVAQSEAESELRETSAKLRTIVEGLGVQIEGAQA